MDAARRLRRGWGEGGGLELRTWGPPKAQFHAGLAICRILIFYFFFWASTEWGLYEGFSKGWTRERQRLGLGVHFGRRQFPHLSRDATNLHVGMLQSGRTPHNGVFRFGVPLTQGQNDGTLKK